MKKILWIRIVFLINQFISGILETGTFYRCKLFKMNLLMENLKHSDYISAVLAPVLDIIVWSVKNQMPNSRRTVWIWTKAFRHLVKVLFRSPFVWIEYRIRRLTHRYLKYLQCSFVPKRSLSIQRLLPQTTNTILLTFALFVWLKLKTYLSVEIFFPISEMLKSWLPGVYSVHVFHLSFKQALCFSMFSINCSRTETRTCRWRNRQETKTPNERSGHKLRFDIIIKKKA